MKYVVVVVQNEPIYFKGKHLQIIDTSRYKIIVRDGDETLGVVSFFKYWQFITRKEYLDRPQ